MAKTKRQIATGIYKDQYGYAVVVHFGGEALPPKRFPLDSTDPNYKTEKELKQFRKDWLLELAVKARDVKVAQTTLAADIKAFLADMPEDVRVGVKRTQRKAGATVLLGHWLKTDLAELPRDEITPIQVREQLQEWRELGAGEQTCDNRRQELSNIYTAFNGKSGYNPIREVAKYNKTYDDPRGFDVTFLRSVIESMSDRGKATKGEKRSTVNLAKIRLKVMWACGIPPALLKQVEEENLNLKKKELWVKRRSKGAGAKSRLVPLSDDAVEAFRALIKHNAFGYFDQRGVNKAFKAAVANARVTWKQEHPDEPFPLPKDITAYDLRHSFLSEVFRRCKNLKTVGHVAIHADGSRVTHRYVQAAVADVARADIAMMNAQPSA